MQAPQRRPAPETETELQQRYHSLAGQRIADIAGELHWPVPDNLHSNKGWQGQLLEAALGCDAASKSEPDFTLLDIELKTIPIDSHGKVLESTYVCIVPLSHTPADAWQHSCAYKKLKRVLWIPLMSESVDIAERIIGTAILWTPTTQQMAMLQSDWQEFTSMINLGQLQDITSKHGDALQIRPKGADAKALSETINAQGETIQTMPRGYYLRPGFTQNILKSCLY